MKAGVVLFPLLVIWIFAGERALNALSDNRRSMFDFCCIAYVVLGVVAILLGMVWQFVRMLPAILLAVGIVTLAWFVIGAVALAASSIFSTRSRSPNEKASAYGRPDADARKLGPFMRCAWFLLGCIGVGAPITTGIAVVTAVAFGLYCFLKSLFS